MAEIKIYKMLLLYMKYVILLYNYITILNKLFLLKSNSHL